MVLHRSRFPTSFSRPAAAGLALLLLLVHAGEARAAFCGDAVVGGGETCDDGAFADGDGCSARCEAEALPATDEVACLAARNRSLQKLAKARGKASFACIRGGLSGTEPDAGACLATDPGGKIAGAGQSFRDVDSRSCAIPPSFGYLDAESSAQAMLAAGPGLVEDVFGSSLASTLAATSGDRDAASCQLAVAKADEKLLAALFDAPMRCQAEGLSGGSIRSASQLAGCNSTFDLDPRGKVDAAAGNLAKVVAAKCNGVDRTTAFPGRCASATSAPALSGCLEERGRCRACLALRTFDALASTCCDALDDATMNSSCQDSSAPPASLADAARAAGIHAGTIVDAGLSTARRDVAAAAFTSATIENSLKWAQLSSGPGLLDFTDADAAVELAEGAGLRVRGHTLFWDRLNGRPGWLSSDVLSAPDPAAQLTSRMQAHAAAVVGRYAGRIAQWDVVNEPLESTGPNLDPANLFFQVLGEQYLDVAFAAARAADPDAKLFLNETLTETLSSKFNGLVSLVESLVARGVPIDGVGLQGHFFLSAASMNALKSRVQRLVDLGLTVEFTEVDVPRPLFVSSADPDAAQAVAFADVFGACAAVPGCTGVTVWGIDDGDTWLDTFSLTQANAPNEPLLFDASLQPKPAYHAAIKALACR